MTTRLRRALARLGANEDLNFLLTNRLPRRWATQMVGRLSKIEQPWVRVPCLWLWQLFAEVELDDTEPGPFRSMHACFTRALRPGTRPMDARDHILTSPCDGIIGAMGSLNGLGAIQAKGFPYQIDDLLGDAEWAAQYRDGSYVTLRLTSGMYHRFHAPADGEAFEVNYVSGDVWNVNPIALKRIERLFCKNERAVIKYRLSGNGSEAGPVLTLVPVAAILVASIRLHWLDVRLHLRYRGPNRIPCSAQFHKGQEMGWFEHGSTIIVFAPPGIEVLPQWRTGMRIRMGEALFSR